MAAPVTGTRMSEVSVLDAASSGQARSGPTNTATAPGRVPTA